MQIRGPRPGECTLSWRSPDAEPSAGVAPFSLTTQDGVGLELVAVKSRAYVEDPLALTELHLTFRKLSPDARP